MRWKSIEFHGIERWNEEKNLRWAADGAKLIPPKEEEEVSSKSSNISSSSNILSLSVKMSFKKIIEIAKKRKQYYMFPPKKGACFLKTEQYSRYTQYLLT